MFGKQIRATLGKVGKRAKDDIELLKSLGKDTAKNIGNYRDRVSYNLNNINSNIGSNLEGVKRNIGYELDDAKEFINQGKATLGRIQNNLPVPEISIPTNVVDKANNIRKQLVKNAQRDINIIRNTERNVSGFVGRGINNAFETGLRGYNKLDDFASSGKGKALFDNKFNQTRKELEALNGYKESVKRDFRNNVDSFKSSVNNTGTILKDNIEDIYIKPVRNIKADIEMAKEMAISKRKNKKNQGVKAYEEVKKMFDEIDYK